MLMSVRFFSARWISIGLLSLCCTVKHGKVDTLCCWGDLSGLCLLRLGIRGHWHTHLGLLR